MFEGLELEVHVLKPGSVMVSELYYILTVADTLITLLQELSGNMIESLNSMTRVDGVLRMDMNLTRHSTTVNKTLSYA